MLFGGFRFTGYKVYDSEFGSLGSAGGFEFKFRIRSSGYMGWEFRMQGSGFRH